MIENISKPVLAHYTQIMHSTKINKYGYKTKRWTWSILRTVFLLGFCFIILYPLLNMISRAFMHPVDLYDNNVYWLPKHFTLSNINLVAHILNYKVAFRNSFLMASMATILQTIACMLAGYGFARFKIPCKKLLFAFVLLTIMVPPQLIMVSTFVHFRFFDIFGIIELITGKKGINMIDTFVPHMLLAATGMGIKNGLFIYIFRQFFRGMPKETEEAALVDGAGPFKTFYKIMAPGATMAIVTVMLFSFVWQWNDTFFSGMFLKDVKVLPLTYSYLRSVSPEFIVKTSPLMAKYNLWNPIIRAMLSSTGVLLMITPLIVLYTFAQRYFVESIERSGIVG